MSEFNPWVSDLGNGNYKNPVLFADYSDPDVIRVDDTFYMTASSFNCTPGLPILKSKDLVNWVLIGHGIENVPNERFNDCQPGCGVWAPAMRYFNSNFFIVFPMPDEGLYVIETKNPVEGWSKPHLLLKGKGLIDPCPFWDDDGKAYVVHGYAFSRCGIKSKLNLIEVSPDLKTVLDNGKIIIDAMGKLPTLEGPKMFKKYDKYYISAPVGGVPQGCQMIFRSDSLWGPYEEKTILAQRGSRTNGPHQGAFVDDTEGKLWFIHFQDYQPWGRIVHLQPASWKDQWPIPGVDHDKNMVGRPVQEYNKPAGKFISAQVPADSDDFSTDKLGLQWQWNANHKNEWFEVGNNKLRLIPGVFDCKNFHLYQRILGQKLNAPYFKAVVNMEFNPVLDNEEAGICIVGMESARIGIRKIENKLSIVYTINDQIIITEEISTPKQMLFVEMNEGGFCRFGIKKENDNYYLGQGYQSVKGKWIGARFGLYCFGKDGSTSSAIYDSVDINKDSKEN